MPTVKPLGTRRVPDFLYSPWLVTRAAPSVSLTQTLPIYKIKGLDDSASETYSNQKILFLSFAFSKSIASELSRFTGICLARIVFQTPLF